MPESPQYNTQGRGVGQYATGWKIIEAGKGKYVVYVSETHSYPGTTAMQQAADNINKAVCLGLDSLVASHRAWWHDYYQKSFLSIPNSRLESFYWI